MMVPLAIGLVLGDYSSGRSPAEVKGWFTRKLLTSLSQQVIAPAALPWWIPAGQPPATILRYDKPPPGLPS